MPNQALVYKSKSLTDAQLFRAGLAAKILFVVPLPKGRPMSSYTSRPLKLQLEWSFSLLSLL
jgi:hypothetical protein